MKFKNKLYTIILLIILFIIALNTNIYAIEIKKGEYSEKYEEWLQLDEEERRNTIPPLPINVRKTSSNNTLTNVKALLKSTTIIPETYDLRDRIKEIEVKDQMNTGLCWGFSANTSLETYLALNEKNYNFSERHIEYNTAKNFTNGTNPDALNREIGDGGYSTTAFTYYSRGSGPILEEDMTFENNEDSIGIEELPTNVAVQKVDDMVYFSNIYKYIENGKVNYTDASNVSYSTSEITQIRNEIKEHIMEKGGITVSINYTSSYYNSSTCAYNYTGSNYSNHAVTIIGWDDTYSKNNFRSTCEPTTDGAYIVLNSWGKEWGDNGIFYVSYEDVLIESEMRAVTSVSDIKYDHLYQYDTSEMYGYYPKQYAANVFTSEGNETLTEVMIGTWSEQTCNIYVNTTSNDLNINNLTQIASNETLKPGYNTIEIEDNIEFSEGNKFSIVVELIGDYSGVGIECEDIYFSNTVSNEGESYISDDGISWYDLYDEDDMINLCIKAYTETEEKGVSIGEVRGTAEQGIGGTLGIPISTTYEQKGNIAEINIYKENKDVTSDFTISGNTIRGKGAYLTIECPSTIERGKYTLTVKLPNLEIVSKNIYILGEPIDLEDCSIEGITNKEYTGGSLTQNINITYESKTLVEGTDYTITYDNNIYPGKATIKIEGIENYTGIKTKNFYITPRQVTGLKSNALGYNNVVMEWNKESYVDGYELYKYNSSTSEYEKIVTTTSNLYDVSNLKEGTSYKFKVRTYKTIDGEIYYGRCSSVVTVLTNSRIDISKCDISGIKDKPYTGNNLTQSIKVIYKNKTLSNGKDYKVTYSNNKHPGKATVKIIGIGDYKGTITKTFKISIKKVTDFKVKKQTTSSITINWSKITGVTGYKIYSYNYSKNKYEYVGKTKSNSYTIKKLKSGTIYKYRVRAYVNVQGIQHFGSYSSSVKTATRTKSPKITKLTTKNKNVTIKWKKVTGSSGYEIHMATSKKGKYSKVKTIKKSTTLSFTKKSLSKKKTYYFKVKAYKIVNGKKIYSEFSSRKSIKVK